MSELFDHQVTGVKFLVQRKSAMLADCMGLGKSRQALVAASQLFASGKIDRVLVLAPAAVRYAWREELSKIGEERFITCEYDVKAQKVVGSKLPSVNMIPVLIVSYGLLPQERHVKALSRWINNCKSLLICDESSFLKNRTAKQSKGAFELSCNANYTWLLTGTPIANSPMDLYMQGRVMAPTGGPLAGVMSFYHFRAKYFIMGGFKNKVPFVNEEKLPELTKQFSPYVLRREKKDCLDLPEKTYTVREVSLSPETWKIYQELKREALLCLPDSDAKPEPNAAVRILRLCQLTSGHVGIRSCITEELPENMVNDVSSEKLSYLADSILEGELSSERALIVWCRWRRERERLAALLRAQHEYVVLEIFGGQSQLQRDTALGTFGTTSAPSILISQQHSGGFGLNLTAASTAVYMSNTFSHIDRVQSEDRIHRIGQKHPCLYIDVVAVGPKGQRTVDHHVLDALRAKKGLADMTCKAWREVLSD